MVRVNFLTSDTHFFSKIKIHVFTTLVRLSPEIQPPFTMASCVTSMMVSVLRGILIRGTRCVWDFQKGLSLVSTIVQYNIVIRIVFLHVPHQIIVETMFIYETPFICDKKTNSFKIKDGISKFLQVDIIFVPDTVLSMSMM
eukprot:TRINITY_DN7799_c0_g1_i13.p1 TRINITY_DN7799_c0_g1~~TRINITY_DN7799_c0_g1_i13.p1  ORF type:complete len:141 (-),score=10.20 TRINITY_DN7799_c0_g1_i13:629-1051(-)